MRKFFLLLILTAVLLACNNSSTESQQKFSVKIKVVDENNNPVPDAHIIFTNKLSRHWGTEWPHKAYTTIRFLTKGNQDSLKINIIDLNGNLVKSLYNNKPLAGNHRITWNGKNDNEEKTESGVYKVISECYKNDEIVDTQEIEIYQTVFEGQADENGEYYTESSYPFLNLNPVDSIKITNDEGSTFGVGAVSDTTIVSASAAGNDYRSGYKYVVVKKAKNEFTVVVKPYEQPLVKHKPAKSLDIKDNGDVVDNMPEFKLYQNCPNPFN